MVLSLEVFKETGFNSDLTGNFFDIVLFNRFHFGINYHNYLFHFVFQKPKKTYFFDIWFSKKRFKDYFSGCYNSPTYTKYIFGYSLRD